MFHKHWHFHRNGSRCISYLFERFVIDKARCILGDVELTLLDVFSELPVIELASAIIGHSLPA